MIYNTYNNITITKILQQGRTDCQIASWYYGVVQSPLDKSDCRKAEQDLNNESNIECIFHCLVGCVEGLGVVGQVVGVYAEPYAICEMHKTESC